MIFIGLGVLFLAAIGLVLWLAGGMDDWEDDEDDEDDLLWWR